MPRTQKGYKLHISLLHTNYAYHNTRDIELSFVTSVSELHHIIQKLYGLKACHLWSLTNGLDNKKSNSEKREVMPGGEMHYNLNGIAQDPDSILLTQFISKKFKTVYYTYDFGIDLTWKIEYKGLTKVPLRSHICTGAFGYYLVEDMPIWEQNNLLDIIINNDKDRLKDDFDWIEDMKHAESIMNQALKKVNTKDLEEAINSLWKYYNAATSKFPT